MVAFAGGLVANLLRREGWAFIGTALAIGLAVVSLFTALFPDVMPSTLDPQSTLTAVEAASSPYTLKAMTIITAIFMPLVLVYQGWTYWVFRKRVTVEPVVGLVKPLDPRLLRRARGARVFLAASVLIGVASGVLIVVQAVLLAHGIAGVVLRGSAVAGVAWGLAVVVVGRALLVWAQEVVAQRAAAAVKSTLRRQVLEHSLKLGPVWLSGERSSALTTLLTKGLDDLDPYFARYLPQLVLAATVPAGVIGWMATGDLIAAGTVLSPSR